MASNIDKGCLLWVSRTKIGVFQKRQRASLLTIYATLAFLEKLLWLTGCLNTSGMKSGENHVHEEQQQEKLLAELAIFVVFFEFVTESLFHCREDNRIYSILME